MCSLEDAFNSFITDDETKNLMKKYEEKDRKLKQEAELKKSVLLTKFNVNFNELNYVHSDFCNKIFASVYRHKTTNQLYFSYINHELDNDESQSEINPYEWVSETEWNKMKEEYEIQKQRKEKQIEDSRPELGEWILRNPGLLKGHKLEIYQNFENGEPESVIAILDNNAGFFDEEYGNGKRIQFKKYPSIESIRQAILEGPIVYEFDEETEVEYHYETTPEKILDKYLK